MKLTHLTQKHETRNTKYSFVASFNFDTLILEKYNIRLESNILFNNGKTLIVYHNPVYFVIVIC